MWKDWKKIIKHFFPINQQMNCRCTIPGTIFIAHVDFLDKATHKIFKETNP